MPAQAFARLEEAASELAATTDEDTEERAAEADALGTLADNAECGMPDDADDTPSGAE
jgi:transcription elongation GreA/GreB family factor